MRTSEKLLRDAADIIAERAKLRDTPEGERSMARAVDAFNGLVGGDKRLTELEGWLFMCCLKMARATAGGFHLDDYADLAGYAALAGECGAGEGDKYGEHFIVEKVYYEPPERSGVVNVLPKCCKYPNPSNDRSYCINCGAAYDPPGA